MYTFELGYAYQQRSITLQQVTHMKGIVKQEQDWSKDRPGKRREQYAPGPGVAHCSYDVARPL